MRRWDHVRPDDPAIVALLDGIDEPEAELCLRIVLSETSRKIAKDRAWRHRVDELRGAVIRTTDDLARVLARTRELARAIEAALAEGGFG